MASMAFEHGRLLLATERAEQAAVFLQLASELNPYGREVWQELARARSALGDSAGAEAALERLQALAEAREKAAVPGFTGQRRQDDSTGKRLAEALEWLERGESDKALNIIRQEISLAPDDPRPRLLEVRTLVGLGQSEAALESIETAVSLFPENPDVLHFRAVVLLGQKELDKAEEDLGRVLELRSDHLPAMNDLALVRQLKGDLAGARQWLERVLTHNPDDPLAKQRLANLEAAEE
jgi:tetratricopeptide (TPR) repeat protein